MPETMNATESNETIEHLNNGHADTVLLFASQLLDIPASASAHIVEIAVNGIVFNVMNDEKIQNYVLLLSGTASTAEELRTEMFCLLLKARTEADAVIPLTSLERELTGAGLKVFTATVARIEELTPSFRQITLTGNFEGYVPAGRLELTVDSEFTWAAYEMMSEAERPRTAYYTIRAFRPERNEIDLWVVLHDENPASSTIASWAKSVTLGDPVALYGPRRSLEIPDFVDTILVFADTSGLAAASLVKEQTPNDHPIRLLAFSEKITALDAIAATRPNVDIRWIGPTAHNREYQLVEGVQGYCVEIGSDQVSDHSKLFVFGAGESRLMPKTRRHLRDELQLGSSQVSVRGYWRK